MKVLFVCSGNSGKLNVIVENQSKSLQMKGIEIDFYLVKGKGVIGYLKNVAKLRRKLKSEKYALIHAHYSFSGYLCVLSRAFPLVVSLMGSDVKSKTIYRILNKFLFKTFSSAIIVKSNNLAESVNFNHTVVIPNGVNLKKFEPKNKNECIKQLEWKTENINLIFVGNPNRPEKNFKIIEDSIREINDASLKIHVLNNIDHNELTNYYSAADGLILSSLWEGSPNTIKEAMACNLPILATNVGDIEFLFGSTEGHFLSSTNSSDFYENFKKFIFYLKSESAPRTKGRKQIINLGLNEEDIAKKITDVYKSIIDG